MEKQVTIYYDGLCILCSKEILHYKKQKGAENFRLVDITAPDFSAKQEQVDPFLVHKIMHVRDENGALRTKVDAFIAIWDALPQYRFLSKLARNSFVRPILDLGYIGFATIRPYLPRRKALCEASPYCELKQEQK